MHHPLRRILPALAALGIAAAAPLVAAGPAQAHESCGDAAIEYSVDNGAHWQTGGRMSAPHGTIQVRLDGDVSKGCSYQVSLASYSTQGPTWGTSGTQTFLGWATTTLSQDHRQATLDISSSLPPCFGQIDLYNGATKYDGVSGPLPKYPNGVFPDNLITAWNGGTACQGTPPPTPPPSPSPSDSAPAPTGPTTPPPANGTPSGGSTPSAPKPPVTKPSAPVSGTVKPSTSAAPITVASPSVPSAPATGEPVGTPSVKPVSATPTNLAFTGTNGGQLVTFGVGGAVLLAAGVGAVVFTRRRSAHR
ncbi:hypothetical protein ABH930_006630 [Kitasatospora sp. GAS204A]|uniref:hypothetical protein n=1 Tax=unclassified Kitasatospora TaxID=2633591 RepID=UPI002473C648|nr:hypothetical protein [Kitasatospora sp. GAS204B]MDH6121137.1 hypothetical protein [Kitasatospora sp. GAS204B]